MHHSQLQKNNELRPGYGGGQNTASTFRPSANGNAAIKSHAIDEDQGRKNFFKGCDGNLIRTY
jgi:hypothetical protein